MLDDLVDTEWLSSLVHDFPDYNLLSQLYILLIW